MNDVAVTEQRAVASYSVNEVRAQIQQVQILMKEAMQDGTHYGKSFPGDTKKNLLKPGADKLMFMFRLRPDFEQEIKELPNGHREIITRCKVYHIESGNKIAEGVGSASTMESKFRYRNSGRKCPECGKETIKESKFDGGGFYCYAKIGGCGAKFNKNDPGIINQHTGKIENPDIADCYNTVLKMSKKRAYVDATITATAASDIFTQDLEDMNGQEENIHTDDLAGEAVNGGREIRPAGKPAQTNGGENRQAAMLEEFKNNLEKKSPDLLPYFTLAEKDGWKNGLQAAASMGEFEAVCGKLKAELAKREAFFKPVPFDDGFRDDYPFDGPEDAVVNGGQETEEIEIF